MEGLHYLRYMLQQGDYMCKLDMKDAYFLVSISLFLTPEKMMKVASQFLKMYETEKVSILQLTKVVGLLNSTAQAA